MTSGIFQSYPLSNIWVDRIKRQRRELDGIPELAESISRVGLINPPVIRRSGELVAGERRLEAVRSLGWTNLSVQIAEDMDPHEFHAIELEENIRRKNLSWQDECRAVEEYHQLRAAKEKGWTTKQTAEALGMTPQEAGQRRDIARELAKGNTRVAEAPKFSTARGIIQRDQERKAAALKETLAGPKPEPPAVPIIQADFIEWQKTYSGEKFNFLHCDFPYGVGAQKMDMQDASANLEHGTYEDDFHIYMALLDALHRAMDNVVAESAHLMFWFSMTHYNYTLSRLTDMGWKVDSFPLIWYKSDNSGIVPDPSRGPRRVYETCFFAHRGDRKIVTPVSNAFAHSVTNTIHMSEKPLPMLRHFTRMIVDEYTRALDPTAGSGNAVIAVKYGGGESFGLEINPEFCARAQTAYRATVFPAQTETDN